MIAMIPFDSATQLTLISNNNSIKLSVLDSFAFQGIACIVVSDIRGGEPRFLRLINNASVDSFELQWLKDPYLISEARRIFEKRQMQRRKLD